MNRLLRFLRLGVIVSPLPYTLINGTEADANQVMADLQHIVDNVNANATAGVGTVARNVLANGAMLIAQRYGTGSHNVSATSAYVLDRWQVKSGAGSSADIARIGSTGLDQFQYAQRVQRTAANAAVTTIQLAQSLETADTYPLVNQTVTLSFRARAGANYSPASGGLDVAIVTGLGTDENVLTGYTGATTPISGSVTLGNSWANYSVSGAVPPGVTELGVIFTMTPAGAAGAADYFDITGVQLELGPGASNFDFEPFTRTVERCQRYYQKSFWIEQPPATNSTVDCAIYTAMVAKAGVSFFFATFVLPVRMRDVLATGTVYNPQAANNQARDTIAGADFTGTLLQGEGISASISATGPGGAAVGDQVWFNWSLDGEL